MFPRLRGGPGAGRALVLALLAVVIGAAVLLRGGDRMSTPTTRLAVTGTAPAPSLVEVASPPAAVPTASGEVLAASAVPDPAPAAPTTTTVRATAASPAARPEPTTAGTTAAPAETTSSTTARTTPTPAPTTTAAPSTTTTTATTVPAGPARAPAAEAEVVPLTNRDRRAEGLGALSRDACLDGVASRYAEQLARSGVLAHNPGAGPAVTGCRPGATWGDNIGTSEPCDTALIEEKWMASPSHRHNILTGPFTLVGVGAWTDAAGGCWVQVLFST